ncbi:unnamed protein product [Rhizoctonia solani]|uniref:Uncharacterized protein n=1 Tax=Rhizoctonia solani TaxID=456999 RepID=A0A8H3BKN1_9AGAM|nr:unnamed protein product [Rhizoctonia solani]
MPPKPLPQAMGQFFRALDAPVGPPTSKTPAQLATEVTAEEERRTAALFKRLEGQRDKLLNQVGGNVDAFLKKVEAEVADHLDHSNPLTRRNHENAKICWATLLKMYKPLIPREAYWIRTVVQEFACPYILIRFKMTPGKDSDHVKAITVASWAGHLIFCIAHFTYDPVTQLKCGHELLTGQSGLYMSLMQTVKDLVFRYNLDRYVSGRYAILGKQELQLAIEYALLNSSSRGRGPRLQTICALLLHFGSGARPSSLAAIHKDMYMRLGDFKVFHVAFCRFDVHVNFKHFKGHYTTILGTQAKHVYKGLSKPTYGSAAHLNMMFIMIKAGGSDFVEPLKPTLADNLSHQVAALLTAIGIKGSAYGFRRGAPTELDVTAGASLAGLVLNHRDTTTVLHRHYSLGTATLDLLGLRLGEVDEPLQPGVEERLALNARLGAAVMIIASDLSSKSLESNDEAEQPNEKPGQINALSSRKAFEKLRKDEVVETMNESDQVQDLKDRIAQQWDFFLAPCRPGSALYKKYAGWSKVKQNVTKIAKEAAYKDALNKASPDVARAAQGAQQLLYGGYEGLFKLKQNTAKVVTRRMNRERADKTETPTTSNVDSAMSHFDQPSHILTEAVEYNTAPQNLVTDPSNNALAEVDIPLTELTDEQQELQQAVMSIGADEEEAEEEHLREGTKDVRAMLLRFAVAPIMADRAYRKQVLEDNGQVICRKCDRFPKYKQERHKFKDRSALNEHIPFHTEWHDLELRMHPKGGKSYGCPAMDCPKGFDSVKEVRIHCMSEKCPEQAGFLKMKEEDDMLRDARAQSD